MRSKTQGKPIKELTCKELIEALRCAYSLYQRLEKRLNSQNYRNK